MDSGDNRSTASVSFKRQVHGDEFMVGYDRTGSVRVLPGRSSRRLVGHRGGTASAAF
jgi:hypothetical protein